jgi:hypothetical protein
MGAFQTPVDIGNRALQHCGAKRMDATLGFTEISKNAREISFAYDKVREAELRANVWRFAVRRTMLRAIDTSTMLLAAAMWVSTTTYFVGSIVSDENGTYWISRVANNLGNDPLNSLTWEPYFGPLTVALYDTGEDYSAGELVYTTTGDGTAKVYLSLQNGNSDTPGTATDYDATQVYSKNQVVTYSSVAYMSLIDLNQGNTPTSSAAAWIEATVYSIGQAVTGTDGVRYTSVGNGNTGHDPTADDGTYWTNTGILTPWTTDFVGGTGSIKWLQIGGAGFPNGVGLTTLNILYPVSSGPSRQLDTRNVFMLPAGYLRQAPQYSKGQAPALGGPSGVGYNDWNFENEFIVSSESGPIAFRFVFSITDVRRMDPMFCEALSARLGMEVCEPVTQSSAKVGTCAQIYDEWVSKAQAANGIEMGYDDPPDDDYVTVRY